MQHIPRARAPFSRGSGANAAFDRFHESGQQTFPERVFRCHEGAVSRPIGPCFGTHRTFLGVHSVFARGSGNAAFDRSVHRDMLHITGARAPFSRGVAPTPRSIGSMNRDTQHIPWARVPFSRRVVSTPGSMGPYIGTRSTSPGRAFRSRDRWCQRPRSTGPYIGARRHPGGTCSVIASCGDGAAFDKFVHRDTQYSGGTSSVLTRVASAPRPTGPCIVIRSINKRSAF